MRLSENKIGRLFRGKRILIVGDIMLDQYLEGKIERMSPEAPVPILDVHQIRNQLGGAANVAANVASLGAQAFLMGHVGEDMPGQIVRNLLTLHRVAFIPLSIPDRQTTLKTRLVSGHQQMIRFDQETKTQIHEIEKAMELALRRLTFNGIILSDYDKGVLTPDSIAFFREIEKNCGMRNADCGIMKNCGLQIADCGIQSEIRNPQFPKVRNHQSEIRNSSSDIPIVVDPKQRNFWEYQGFTAITPNLSEALKATEQTDHQLACEQIQRMLNPKQLLLKRGEQGMVLMEGEQTYEIPAHRVEVADVTGAGDTVIATYTLGLSSGMTALEAAKLANLAASISVQHHGCYHIKPEDLNAHIL